MGEAHEPSFRRQLTSPDGLIVRFSGPATKLPMCGFFAAARRIEASKCVHPNKVAESPTACYRLWLLCKGRFLALI